MKHFKTFKALREASAEDILEVQGIPKSTAENIYNYFHPLDKENQSQNVKSIVLFISFC